ncbi:hypothetical protein SCLCIDRAFT_1219158 [Scleroderma citrinum Foug A]|uniref:Uncharacterized protein n=1 Tax=Scleroderma citrinum Foug A TaxID=1036808 RepID=A0A0C2ZZB1_9AGAM|nr:hypothetical protein SCLCIDRAFT_1219158 [Scleroderma citrinum Foug A]
MGTRRIKIYSRIKALARPYRAVRVVIFGQDEADISALTSLMAHEYDSGDTQTFSSTTVRSWVSNAFASQLAR